MIEQHVHAFLTSLPLDKCLVLGRSFHFEPNPEHHATFLTTFLYNKMIELAWSELFSRLSLSTLTSFAHHLGISIQDHSSSDHATANSLDSPSFNNDEAYVELVNKLTHALEGQGSSEVFSTLPPKLLGTLWEELGIRSTPNEATWNMEHLIGGLETMIGFWTVVQIREIITLLEIPIADYRKLKKDQLIFHLVKVIVAGSFTESKKAALLSSKVYHKKTELSSHSTLIPPAKRNQIQPSNIQRKSLAPIYIHQGKRKSLRNNVQVDQENSVNFSLANERDSSVSNAMYSSQ